MRDQRKDLQYWAEQEENAILYIAEDRAYMLNESESEKTRGRSAGMYINGLFTQTLAFYSAGKPIDEIAALARNLLAVEYPAYLRDFSENQYGPTRPRSCDMVRYLSLLILCDLGAEETKAFIEAYDHWDYTEPPVKGHRDHICEAMVAYLGFGQGRAPSTGVNWPAAYKELWGAIDPQTEDFAREAYRRRFLATWYKDMSKELAAQTDLHGPENTPGLYVGYWCIEAAAAAVMMNISDLSFRDHEHYPKDFADWARARKAKR